MSLVSDLLKPLTHPPYAFPRVHISFPILPRRQMTLVTRTFLLAQTQELCVGDRKLVFPRIVRSLFPDSHPDAAGIPKINALLPSETS